MRIALVTPEYPPGERLGGIATNTEVLAKALAQRDHEIRVVTRGDRSSRSRVDDIEVVRIDHRWLPSHTAASVAARVRVALAVREFAADIVHAPEWSGDAWALTRWTRRPVVTRLATPSHVVEELNGIVPGPREALIRRFEREQTEGSAAVYAPTTAIIDRVAADWSIPAAHVRRIPNPVSISAIRAAGAASPRLDLPERFIAFVGRLERRKGVVELARALAVVLEEHPAREAVIIGNDPGEEGGAVRREIEDAWRAVADRVHVLGELQREDALAVLARAELSVVPSLWESFGYVCVEAMALRVPVIACDTGGLAEIVAHGESGWLTPPGDADALATSMLERFADAEDTAKVAAAGQRRAEDFDVDVIVDEVEALLREASDHATFQPSLYRAGYRRYFRPEESRDPFAALYAEKRERVLAHFDAGPPRRLVDVGGGFGRLSAPLSRRHDVVHCDLGMEMLHEARSRHGRAVPFVQADGRRLPFPDGAFDALLAMDLLVHLDDLESGLRELRRVVKPGGELVFDTTNASAWWVLRYPAYTNWRPRRTVATMRGGGVLPEWQQLVRHQTTDEVRDACRAAGLTLGDSFGVGPRPSPKWHVWVASRDGA